MKKGGGQFAPILDGHFELESGGHFKLELGGQYHWNLQLITAVTRNCCFSVSCSSFFPIFVCGNGEISVTKPQLRVAAKR